MHKEHLKERDLEPSGNRKKQNKSHLSQHFGQSIYRIIIKKKKEKKKTHHRLEPMGYRQHCP